MGQIPWQFVQIATRVAPFTVAIWVVKISPCFDMSLPIHLPRIYGNYVLWVKIKVCSPNKLNASRKECTESLGCWVFGRFFVGHFCSWIWALGQSWCRQLTVNVPTRNLAPVCLTCKLAMQDMFRPVQRLQRKDRRVSHRKRLNHLLAVLT